MCVKAVGDMVWMWHVVVSLCLCVFSMLYGVTVYEKRTVNGCLNLMLINAVWDIGPD